MANKTIPDLTALGANVAAGDLLEIADVSNANASRKVTQQELIAVQSSPTIDSPTLTGTTTAATVNATTGNVTTFRVLDAVDQSHGMQFVIASNLTANRTLTLTTGDANRSITISGDVVLPVGNLGYLGAPQNSQSADYTTLLSDAGNCIFHPASDNNARTFTIDSNANVAFPIGTIIEFLNMAVASVTIAITSDTLTLLPTGTTGSRTLAQYGRASAEKISSTAWIISGNSALT